MYRDLADAARALYGESVYGMHTFRMANEKESDDLAEAWIRGEHDRVFAAIADREARLRASLDIVKPRATMRRILELRKRGWEIRRIATELGATATRVARVCRRAGLGGAPALRGPRKVNRLRLQSLLAQGLKQRVIAEMENLHESTVSRVLRGKQ